MPSRQRLIDAADRRSRLALAALQEDFRQARVERGLSQQTVGAAAGVSQSEISKFERGLRQDFSVPLLSRLLACVGLVLSTKSYPDSSPIRDAGHRALLERFRRVVAPTVKLRFEVPLPGAGDLRAWDATLALGQALVGVEAETAPRDVQALQRRVALKLRDDPRVAHVLLVLADTRGNRRLLKEHGEALRTEWTVPREEMLAALRAGRDPGGSGIILM